LDARYKVKTIKEIDHMLDINIKKVEKRIEIL